jgi:predicted ribosomally synthesized peptide with SipW-like signal peptide
VNARSIRSFLAGALVVGIIAFGSGSTYAAFTSQTSSDSNTFSTGTVSLVDNDGGSVMFNLSGVRPTDPAQTSCVKVTYNGSLDADVRLYAAVSSTGVEQYLNLKVETGTSTSGFGACGGFSPGSTLFNGTLSGYPTSFAAGIDDPASPWTTGTTRAYRFTVSLQNNAAAQGLTGTATFDWEARNV